MTRTMQKGCVGQKMGDLFWSLWKARFLRICLQNSPRKVTSLSFGGFTIMDSAKLEGPTIMIFLYAVNPAPYDQLGR